MVVNDLDDIKNKTRDIFLQLLSKYETPKTIIWDDKLIGPFEFVATTTLLKKHGVSQMHRLSYISNHKTIPKKDNILYLIRKNYSSLKKVSQILSNIERTSLNKTSLIFVPQKCESSIRYLKYHKVDLDSLFCIEELPIAIFILDHDLMSMENNLAFKELNLQKDLSCLKHIVDNLIMIQDIFGEIPKISGQGDKAKLISNQLLKHRKLSHANKNGNFTDQVPKFSHLLLLDRNIDLLTPLLTQLTYEGILDEVIGISDGKVELPDKRIFRLHGSEELFSKLRDTHINNVAKTLKQTARNLQNEFDESQSKVHSVQEMRKIVKKIPFLKKAKESHANHLSIAEHITKRTLEPEFIYGLRIEHELLQEGKVAKVLPEIEIKLARQDDPIHILRLICIHSQTSSGLKQKVCEFYKRELIQNAGFEYITLLNDLSSVSILVDQEKDFNIFTHKRDKYDLITENVDEANPNHPSYVYGGYLPYTIYLSKFIAQTDLARLPEPGFTHELKNTLDMVLEPETQEKRRIILVFFIGGCTYAEISALRFLGRQYKCNFVIATTNIVNGNSLVQSFM